MEVVLTKAIEALTAAAKTAAEHKLARSELVIHLLTSIGLKPDQPPADFEAVYAYALVQYGAGKPPEALELFRQPEIRDAFRRSFNASDPGLLESEAGKFLEWNRLGDQFRSRGIEPRREFALFTAAFNETADATRNPSDVRRDHQIGAILDSLAQVPDLSEIRTEIARLRELAESRRFTLTPASGKLKVFISSRMEELRDLRATVHKTLAKRGFDPFLYESVSGARPEAIAQASLLEVEASDIYLGVFDATYGEIAIEEFKHARSLNKPCFVYLRDKNVSRETRLQRFLDKDVVDPRSGVAYSFFDNAEDLAERAANDIMSWLVREHRVKSAQLKDAGTSQEEHDRLKKEVDRLQRLFRDSLPEGSALDLLAANLEIWFRVSGYPLEKCEVRAPDHCERIISVPERQGQPTRVLVYAVEGAAELADLRKLKVRAQEQGIREAWLISPVRKTPAVIDDISQQDSAASPKLSAYTFDELIDLAADFTGYFGWLEEEVANRKIDRKYIQLACTKTEFDSETKKRIGVSVFNEKTGWIDKYIDQWLDDPSKEHISILGQFGTGKTWFALHYAWLAMQRYRDAQANGLKRPRLPIYIALRDHPKAIDVKNLLSDFFFTKERISIRGYAVFEELNRMGRFLLIFDGFDEMAERIDRDKMLENFDKLAQVVSPRSKVILTSRTEHFPSDEESRELLSSELRSPKFEVLELQQLQPDQIRLLLSREGLSEAAIKRIVENGELLDLAKRPVMVELIIESLEEIGRGAPIDVSRIYLYAIRRKMERDIQNRRTFTSLADKLYFLCELSWAMIVRNKMTINYQDFPAEITRLFGSRIKGSRERDYLKTDMMSQNMLIRKEGDYSPAHRSLLEFCVAYKLAAELGIIAGDFTAAARQQAGIKSGSQPEDRTWSRHFSSESALPLGRFAAESSEQLKKTFGSLPLAPAIRELMVPMLEREASQSVLKRIIGESAQDEDSAAAIMAGNALALLKELESKSLAGLSFPGARFAHVSLDDFDLSDADLSRATFDKCTFRRINLQRAGLNSSVWRGSTILATDLRSANLTGATLETTSLDLTGFFPDAAINGDGSLIAAKADQRIQLWQVESRKMTWLSEEELFFGAPVFVGNSLVANSWWNVEVWDVLHPDTPIKFELPPALAALELKGLVPVPDSRKAWLHTDETIVLADLDSGDILSSFPHKWEWSAVSVAAAGNNYIAVGSSEVLFKTTSGSYTYDPPIADESDPPRVAQLAFSPTSKYLAALIEPAFSDRESKALILFETSNGKGTRVSSPRLAALAFASDTLLLCCTSDGRILLFDVAAGKQAAAVKLPNSPYIPRASFNPAGTALVYVANDGDACVVDTRPFLSRAKPAPKLTPIDTGVNTSLLSPNRETWPEWWRSAEHKPDLDENYVANPRFGLPIYSLTIDRRCDGLQLNGISGLAEGVRDRFVKQGAIYKQNVMGALKRLIARR